jgi:hypothetical protein
MNHKAHVLMNMAGEGRLNCKDAGCSGSYAVPPLIPPPDSGPPSFPATSEAVGHPAAVGRAAMPNPEGAFWAALFGILPAPGAMWPIKKREEWLAMMQTIFNVIYRPDYWRAPDLVCGIPVVTLDARRGPPCLF